MSFSEAEKKTAVAVLLALAAVFLVHVSADLAPSDWDVKVVKKFSKEGDK